jgi:hypothetical protein
MYVITRPRQFVRQRFGGDHGIGLGFLFLELLTEAGNQ